MKTEENTHQKETSYIYGKNAVIEAILSDNSRIEKIFCCFGINNSQILSQAKKQKIYCTTLDKKKFKELEKKICPQSINSQGIIALRSLVATIELADFLSNTNLPANSILVIIDGITDPHNLGAIARSAECAGVNAIIITDKGNAPINPVVVRASAGALNHLNIIKVNNLINACEKLKKNGF